VISGRTPLGEGYRRRGADRLGATTGPQPPQERRLPYLDGIRAFAVLTVLLYHGGVSWVSGGLLGVDVFFVLSGFLITGLLVKEYAERSTIRLPAFWAARARRLLPALFITLLGVSAYLHFFSGSVDVSSGRGDVFATLFYFANWHFILAGQGYFAQAAAPPRSCTRGRWP